MAGESEKGDLLPPGCGLWFGWFFASIAGALLGWIIGWLASFIVPGAVSTLVLGFTMGLLLGFMQWLVLRAHIKGSGWWVFLSALGWGGGFSIGVEWALRLGLTDVFFGLVVGIFTGITLGVFQWIILHRQVPNAGWWVPASAFAWTSSLLYYRPGITGVGAFYGILSGLVTGTVLLWLLYRPEP